MNKEYFIMENLSIDNQNITYVKGRKYTRDSQKYATDSNGLDANLLHKF